MISNRNLQNVIIKGTKEGLTLHLDDSSSFENIIEDLREKLSSSYKFQKDDPIMSVNVHTGNRQFSQDEEKQIVSIIESSHKLVVDKIASNVIQVDEAERIMNETAIKSIVGKVRSGQVLEVPGDLLLIGDVNPGGVIKADGNIFIVGNVRGCVHAGCKGNHEAIVAASVMTSAQISIAETITTTAHSAADEVLHQHCAYINNQKEIAFDRIQLLKQLRPKLTRLEGGF